MGLTSQNDHIQPFDYNPITDLFENHHTILEFLHVKFELSSFHSKTHFYLCLYANIYFVESTKNDDSSSTKEQEKHKNIKGKVVKWAMLSQEFDVIFINQKSIKGQVVVDYLVDAP